MTKIKLNKIFSVLLVFGTVFYYIPKTISMLDWLESGAINSYFYLLAPINIIIIGLSIVSVLSFKNAYNRKHLKFSMSINLIGVVLMILWFPIIYST